MDELLEQFLIEGRELVQQASDDLSALEQRPANSALIDGIFRAVHTLKGSVLLFDFAPMALILHAAEDVLGEARSGPQAIDADLIDTLHIVVEQIGRWLGDITETAILPEGAADTAQDLLATLVLSGHKLDGNASPGPAALTASKDRRWAEALVAKCPADKATGKSLVAVRYTPDKASFFNGYDPIQIVKAVPDLVFLHIAQREKPVANIYYDPFECNLLIELVSCAPMDEVKAAFRFVAAEAEVLQLATEHAEPAAPTITEAPTPDLLPRGEAVAREAVTREAVAREAVTRTVRVDTARIDLLADLVDELVIAKNDMARLAAEAAAGLDPLAVTQALISRQAELDRAVGRLHRAVSSVRLVPFAPLIRRFSAMVRELARSLGKEVDLRIEDQGVEADKSIVDGLFDPLTHLVRNAMDHGIEPTEHRQAHGKPRRASLRLAIARQGNQVLVEVQDDGQGIDPTVIRRIAAQRGIMSQAALAALPDPEVLDLIFMPGFSTADQVTDISGRGVGMDAVRTAIAGLGGKVSIESRLGTGTTVRLNLPLTIALTRMVVVSCAGERYGVPMDTIVETTKIAAGQITPVRAGRALVLRGRTVPLLELASLLGISREQPAASDRKALVVRAGHDLVAIGVDAFLERTELLLRPLTGILSGMRGVAGTALLGDGHVMMVLEPAELIG